MKCRTLLVVALALAPFASQAEPLFPLMRDIAGDRELPKPYGVGLDFFTMHQDYDIGRLAFTLPGVSLDDPDLIEVDNKVWESDIKFDVWVLPFLNVFALLGHVEGDTRVNLSAVSIPQIPGGSLGTLPISYDGRVWGGGVTLAYATEHWFATLTGTYTKADVDGDFDSEVKTTSWQPRGGIIRGPWAFFVGGYYIDAEEDHQGAITLPGLGAVPFEVSLESRDKFNFSAGVHYQIGESLETTLELGGGDRRTTLVNLTARF
jgi:hypothetical protein